MKTKYYCRTVKVKTKHHYRVMKACTHNWRNLSLLTLSLSGFFIGEMFHVGIT